MSSQFNSIHISELNVSEYLQNGTIACVTNQDWKVDRIIPDFLDVEDFIKNINNSDRILHLGMGNGECYRFITNRCNCYQASISDKVYIDPYEIIMIYLKKCNIDNKDIYSLSLLMRDEFLLAISYNRLKECNAVSLLIKDLLIYNLFTSSQFDNPKHSKSYNVIKLLIYLLNNNPSILLPLNSIKRQLNKMGKHIMIEPFEKDLCGIIKSMNSSISIFDVEEYILKQFSTIDNIFIMPFEKLVNNSSIQYDYIIASRSDCFLKNEYADFIIKISTFLSKEGVYLSDGILNSYSYELLVTELKRIADYYNKDNIFLIESKVNSRTLPIRDILGIAIFNGKEHNINKLKRVIPKYNWIAYNDLYKSNSFIRQCIWSDLYAWSIKNGIDLETFTYDDINSIIDKNIETKRKNIYNSISFDELL